MSFTNFIAVDGNVVRDADVKFLDNGSCVMRFSIAHNVKINEKEDVYYFDCVAFGKYAELLVPSIAKGISVLVVGQLQQKRWEKDGQKRQAIQIFVKQVMFNAPKREAGAAPPQTPKDDDIPF